MSDLRKDTRLGGYPIFSAANHGVEGDPHPQYVKNKSSVPAPFFDQKGQWFRIATYQNIMQYNGISTVLLINGGITPEETVVTMLSFKFYQQPEMGYSPSIELALLNSKGFDTSNFMAIITKNDVEMTEVQLFCKIPVKYDSFNIQVLQENNKGVEVIMGKNEEPVKESELPQGSIYKSTFPTAFTTPNGKDEKPNFVRVAVMELYKKHSYRSATIEFQHIGSFEKVTSAKVTFKCQQNDNMGERPNIDLVVTDLVKSKSKIITQHDFIAIERETSEEKSVIELYVRNVPPLSGYHFNIVKDNGDYGTTSFKGIEEKDILEKLPQGYQTISNDAPQDRVVIWDQNTGEPYEILVRNGVLGAFKL